VRLVVSALKVLKSALFFLHHRRDVVVVGKTEFEAKLVFVVKQAETSWL